MAAQGYIGRAPGESSVVVARQTFTPTGITTNFTFVSGYTVGYVDAYLNGVRLIEGSDYTATDGSIVGLSTNAINGDVLELVAYKAFNVSNVTGANGDFSVPDKIIHANDTDTAIRFPQADTFTVETAGSEVIRIDANGNVGIGTTNTLRVADPKNQSGLNVGFITANSITAAAGSFGSLNVSGTLTYEDVANQDVVGFSTFRKGINVQGAGSTTTTLNVTGVTTMTGDVNIAAAFNIPDAITHVGDTNTKIRFPAADTFTVETAGSEAIRVDSSGNVGIGTASPQAKLDVKGRIYVTNTSNASNYGEIYDGGGLLIKSHNSNPMYFYTGGTEKVRIDSSGNVGIGTNIPGANLHVHGAVGGAGQIYVTDGDAAGTGNSFLISKGGTTTTLKDRQASSNLDFGTADTTAMRIDSSQRLLVNTISSTSNIAGYGNGGIQLNSTTTAQANVNIIHRNNSANTHAIVLAKARDGAANGGRVQDDDDFGAISFQGFDGTGGSTYRQGAEIRGAVDGTPGNTDMPGRLEFLTTPDGSATPTERLRITSAGNVSIQNDSGKFTAGAGDDLQIFHNGTDSKITNTQGNLIIDHSDGIIRLDPKTNENGILIRPEGAVELYHNNVLKLETESGGVAIHEDTDKVVRFTGAISEIGSVAGFQATNTAGSALVSFGIRATDIRFATGSAERLRITSGGVVGINTTTGFDTSVGLAVRNGASGSDHTMIDIIANTNESSRLVFSDDTDHNQGRIQYNHTGNSLAFYTNGNNERLSIDSDGNFIFKNGALIENGFHDDGGGLSGNHTHDLGTYGNVHFSATNAAGAFTYNLRINSSATLNSVMSEGDVLSFTLMHASNNTSYYLTQLKIDGTNVTPVWAGGSAPSAATGSGFDVYSFSIMKTGSNAYGIFGTFTNHA